MESRSDTKHFISRKNFIRQVAPFALTVAVPVLARAVTRNTASSLSIGLLSDLHQDVMHDGEKRLSSFLKAMDQRKPDAIAQLGDFCYPSDKNKTVIDAFNNGHATGLHVIGNHDTDAGFTHEQCVRVFGMPSPYYTKVINGYHVIVLNGNEKGSPTFKGGYPAFIGPAQIQWLKAQLNEIKGPVVVICHQPLEGPLAVDNAQEIQNILSSASDRVLLTINGHTHVDRLVYVQDIPYLTINSASYYWVGEKFKHESFTPQIHASYPWISYTCPYQDALFTMLTINPSSSSIRIEGNQSNWIGKSPLALGLKNDVFSLDNEIVPFIRSREVAVRVKKGK